MKSRIKFYATVVAVVIADLILLKTGIINGAQAVALALTAEVAVTLTAVLVALRSARRKAREDGNEYTLKIGLSTILPKRVAGLIAHEVGIFTSLARFLTGRTGAKGMTAYQYRGGVTMLMVIGVVASLAEILVFHFLIPWEWLRIVALLLGAYSLLWVLALWAGCVVYPHLVSSTSVRIQFGHLKRIDLPIDSINQVRMESSMSPKTWWKVDTDSDTFYAPVGNTTNVCITFTSPRPELDGATKLSLAVDKPREFVDDLQHRMAPSQ